MSGSALRFIPLSELVASTPDEPDWIWDGYVARGTITLLAGRPKVGKFDPHVRAHGRDQWRPPFCGRSVRPARIVLLSEERVTTLAEKARALATAERIECLMHHTAYDVEWPHIVRLAAERLGPEGLLIVDTLADFARLPADSENAAGAVQSALRPLQEIAGEGCAVLLVAHQRKAAGDHGEAVRGSNALTAAVDVVLELERAPEGRVIKADSRYAGTPRELVVARGQDGYEARGDLAGALAETERERVIEMLGELGDSTAEAIDEAMKFSKTTVQRRLNALRSAGRVTRRGQGTKGDPFVWARSDASTEDPSGRIASADPITGDPTFDAMQHGAAAASNGRSDGAAGPPLTTDPMGRALFDLIGDDRRWRPEGPVA